MACSLRTGRGLAALGAVAALAVLATPLPAGAQTNYTWTGANSQPGIINDPTHWSNPYNWSPAAFITSDPSTTLTFNNTPYGTAINDLGTFVLNEMLFFSSTNGCTISGNPLNFQGETFSGLVSLSSVSLSITVANNLTLNASSPFNLFGNGMAVTLSGAISGTGSLNVNGGATAVLSNAGNSYSGGTVVNGGTVSVQTAGALPTGQNVTVRAGTLNLNGTYQSIGSLTLSDPSATNSSPAPVVQIASATLSLGGTVTYIPSSTAPAASVTGGTLNLGGATRTFDIGHGGSLYDTVISSTITGTGGLTKTGTGSLALTGSSTFLGPTTVTAGTLYLGVTNALSSAVVVNGGVLAVNLQITGQGVTAGSYNQSFGSLAGSGGVVSLGLATLAVGLDNTNKSYAGTLNGDIGSAVVKVGTGALALTGLNQGLFLGSVTVNGGVLAVNTDLALGAGGLDPSASLTVNPAGTLRYTANASTGRTFTLNGGTLEAASGATLTLNGATVNGGFVTTTGTGVVALTGNTALNGVTLFGGTAVNATGPATLTNVSTGAMITNSANQTLTLNRGRQTEGGSLTVNGTLNTPNGYGSIGAVTINPGGTWNNAGADLTLGGGSVTSVGVYNPANGQVTPGGTVNLGTTNLVVRGGFLRNNGAMAGSGTLVIDYGGLVKGSGDYGLLHVQKLNGGQLLSGNSPGLARFGNTTLDNGGPTGGDFSNATGIAGPPAGSTGTQLSGWSAFEYGDAGNTGGSAEVRGTRDIRAVWRFRTVGDGGDYSTAGPPANFNAAQGYVWPIVRPRSNADVNNPTNVTPVNTVAQIDILDTGTGLPVPLTVASLNAYLRFDAGQWDFGATPAAQQGVFAFALLPDTLGNVNRVIALTYTPVPEPAAVLLVGLAGLAAGWRLRRAAPVP